MLVKADVSDAQAVDRAIKAFLAQRDGIDVLVNNAAIVDDNLLHLCLQKVGQQFWKLTSAVFSIVHEPWSVQ